MNRILVFLILFGVSYSAAAQQMVVIKKGKIITRYDPGNDIRFQLKGDDQVYHAAILQINEFAFITLQKDTIKFADIDKLRFKNPNLKKYVISTVIASGTLMALHFALKGPFGEKNPQAVDGLAYAAGAGLLPITFAMLFNKRKINVGGYTRLKFINYDSPLYR